MQQVLVNVQVEAPVAEAWAIFMDHAGWTRWAGFGRVSLERPGRTEPNGVGAIRVLPGGGREEILEVGPAYRMAYTVISGIPLRNHRGEVTFVDRGDGRFDATWRCHFDSTIPGLGPIFRVGVGWVFRRTLKRLGRETRRRHPP